MLYGIRTRKGGRKSITATLLVSRIIEKRWNVRIKVQ
jgi:hypothetical protein